MSGVDVFKVLSYGVIGLGFLLALLAYRLLSQEQVKKTARPEMLRAIYAFMSFSLLLCIVGLVGQIYPVGTARKAEVEADSSTHSPEGSVDEQHMAETIKNYFEAEPNWSMEQPGEVFGLAKGIVARFNIETDVFGSVGAQIEQHKKNDNN